MTEHFSNWIPLRKLCVGDLPECGGCCAVYAFRDQRNDEILEFGETDTLRRRILGNFLGGVGGSRAQSTTQFVHRELFTNGWIDHVQIAWIQMKDKATAKQMESTFRQAYKATHGGQRPIWDRQD